MYGDIDPITLGRAADRGTAIHKATQELDETGQTEVPSEYEGYIEAYLKFRKEHTVEWELIEHMDHYEDRCAGTIDRFGKVDGEPCILDIKTGKSISKKNEVVYTAQLNLYRLMFEWRYPEFIKLYVLHLKSNGTYRLIKIPYNKSLASACLWLHEDFANATPKRKKKLVADSITSDIKQ